MKIKFGFLVVVLIFFVLGLSVFAVSIITKPIKTAKPLSIISVSLPFSGTAIPQQAIVNKSIIPENQFDKVKGLFIDPNSYFLIFKPNILQKDIDNLSISEALKNILRGGFKLRDAKVPTADKQKERNCLFTAANRYDSAANNAEILPPILHYSDCIQITNATSAFGKAYGNVALDLSTVWDNMDVSSGILKNFMDNNKDIDPKSPYGTALQSWEAWYDSSRMATEINESSVRGRYWQANTIVKDKNVSGTVDWSSIPNLSKSFRNSAANIRAMANQISIP
jgi:hypothetical protein